jgi:starch synthase
MIFDNYAQRQFETGKKKNKEALCSGFGLSPEKPLFTFIGRLVTEKGADLLAESIRRSLSRHGDGINFLVLGTGDKDTENALTALKRDYPGKCSIFIGYDEALAHLIYAGADFLLMPSRVEPCGLNQLYALRYGTIPIVRSTGGLKDTVIDFGDPKGYGIRFNNASVDDICYSIDRAVELYADTLKVQQLRKRMMALDFSWDRSAKEYNDLYKSLIY